MSYKTNKGQISGGEAIGILLLDTSVPFFPGDVPNATAYFFPVRFQKVERFTIGLAIEKNPEIIGSLIDAAEKLLTQGVRTITGDCGFMAMHQKKLAEKLMSQFFFQV